MSGFQKGGYQVWRVLVALIAAACVVQIFLAGRGAFGFHGPAKLDDQKSFDPHRALGEIIGLLAVLAFLAALAAWREHREQPDDLSECAVRVEALSVASTWRGRGKPNAPPPTVQKSERHTQAAISATRTRQTW